MHRQTRAAGSTAALKQNRPPLPCGVATRRACAPTRGPTSSYVAGHNSYGGPATSASRVPAPAPRVDALHASTAAAHILPAAFLQATPVPRLQQPEQRPSVPPPRLALPPTVNWHLEPRCNYHCKFCFATFSDIPAAEVVKDADLLLAVPALLAAAGVSKVTFVGGEPLLHPLLGELIAGAKATGLVTSLVTNGSLMTEEWLRRMQGHLDWLAFSVDASDDALHAALGRGIARETGVVMPRHSGGHRASNAVAPRRSSASSSTISGSAVDQNPASSSSAAIDAVAAGGGDGGGGGGGHLARVEALWAVAQGLGYRLKLNTVVTAPCLDDVRGMVQLVGRLRPERWKVFQVLPITGQTQPEHVAPLLTSEAQFADWVAAASVVQQLYGVPLVPESNSHMHGSYAMLGARGRFYQDVDGGGYEYGTSIFECWQQRLLLKSPAANPHSYNHKKQEQQRYTAAGGAAAVDVHAAALAVLMLAQEAPADFRAGVRASCDGGAAAAVGCGSGSGTSSGVDPNGSGVDSVGPGSVNSTSSSSSSSSSSTGDADVPTSMLLVLKAGGEAVLDAWGAVAGPAFRAEAFVTRGGVYEWGQGGEALEEQRRAWGELTGSSSTASENE
ncbi:hypothetical protein HYH02_012656 [Chlamydomonas schloesseri]|uniref:Radical SAM core domain-containing protein n=1 Tax=Chlamydomonas schloesseri TaxID=2026947 RepID=A0A835SUP5_9CHLO|nr:hypothetical protein HYH02_012656 [Chlamydomonas schloesseri]|eukprot:KAG2433539.1 hypothetical protein HYH02_012656 [Chlamydomonas schloesseri]